MTCEHKMAPATLERFDFSAYVGFPVKIDAIPGQRCARCGYETLTGAAINGAIVLVALHLLRQETRLRGPYARFLRKLMELSQQELAKRMGAHRTTVNGWENEQERISQEHDYILRVMVAVHLAKEGKITLVGEPAFEALSSVRRSQSRLGSRIPSFVIAHHIEEMRSGPTKLR